ncbi:DUF6064 family protein [Thiohalophilus thiocyanatoxydans]|uniref:Uncharacterized protein n=1 Tax=Thiohalophilus thiocyanatoxydans TaxID=381308 RepID=A0A4R8IUL5_9GAMM|nr:DUF6064 family protein [Thiohalophilus thiocyanatoxydans]TDY04358.1 hypothetical protein EDC23_0733 [Thiohalophilus thiocyanatoxydans]
MDIPFTTEQFLDIFRDYNQAVFPLQPVAYLLGLLVIYLLWRPSLTGDRFISAVLALYWLGMGAGYHLYWFSSINGAAYLFGTVFIIQGTWFFYSGLLKNRLRFSGTRHPHSLIGWIFILYALLVYPLLNILMGHHYPAMPVFGLAPCPTTIFTFGILLLARSRIPVPGLIIPLLWSLIGVSAAINLGIWEDIGLVIAGLTGTILIIHSNRHRANSQ